MNLEVKLDVQPSKESDLSASKGSPTNSTPNAWKVDSPQTQEPKKLTEVLSEEIKRANHIASEQKRRQNLRYAYERLIDVVPTLDYSVKGEAVIMDKGKYLCIMFMQ